MKILSKKPNDEHIVLVKKKNRYPIYFTPELNRKYYKNKILLRGRITYGDGLKIFYRFLKIHGIFDYYIQSLKREQPNICFYFDKFLLRNFSDPFIYIIDKLLASRKLLDDKNAISKFKKLCELRKLWYEILRSLNLI